MANRTRYRLRYMNGSTKNKDLERRSSDSGSPFFAKNTIPFGSGFRLFSDQETMSDKNQRVPTGRNALGSGMKDTYDTNHGSYFKTKTPEYGFGLLHIEPVRIAGTLYYLLAMIRTGGKEFLPDGAKDEDAPDITDDSNIFIDHFITTKIDFEGEDYQSQSPSSNWYVGTLVDEDAVIKDFSLDAYDYRVFRLDVGQRPEMIINYRSKDADRFKSLWLRLNQEELFNDSDNGREFKWNTILQPIYARNNVLIDEPDFTLSSTHASPVAISTRNEIAFSAAYASLQTLLLQDIVLTKAGDIDKDSNTTVETWDNRTATGETNSYIFSKEEDLNEKPSERKIVKAIRKNSQGHWYPINAVTPDDRYRNADFGTDDPNFENIGSNPDAVENNPIAGLKNLKLFENKNAVFLTTTENLQSIEVAVTDSSTLFDRSMRSVFSVEPVRFEEEQEIAPRIVNYQDNIFYVESGTLKHYSEAANRVFTIAGDVELVHRDAIWLTDSGVMLLHTNRDGDNVASIITRSISGESYVHRQVAAFAELNEYHFRNLKTLQFGRYAVVICNRLTDNTPVALLINTEQNNEYQYDQGFSVMDLAANPDFVWIDSDSVYYLSQERDDPEGDRDTGYIRQGGARVYTMFNYLDTIDKTGEWYSFSDYCGSRVSTKSMDAVQINGRIGRGVTIEVLMTYDEIADYVNLGTITFTDTRPTFGTPTQTAVPLGTEPVGTHAVGAGETIADLVGRDLIRDFSKTFRLPALLQNEFETVSIGFRVKGASEGFCQMYSVELVGIVAHGRTTSQPLP